MVRSNAPTSAAIRSGPPSRTSLRPRRARAVSARAGVEMRPAPPHNRAVRAVGDAGVQDRRRPAHLRGDPHVEPVAARLVDLAGRHGLAARPRRINRLVGGGRHLLQQFAQMRAAHRAADALGRLPEKAGLDAQPGEPGEVGGSSGAHRVGRKVAGGLAGDDAPVLVHRQAQPHAVDRLAGLDVAAVVAGRAVALGVRELRLDVVEPVGPAVAAQHDVPRMQQFAVLGLAQRHRGLLVLVRRSMTHMACEPALANPRSRAFRCIAGSTSRFPARNVASVGLARAGNFRREALVVTVSSIVAGSQAG